VPKPQPPKPEPKIIQAPQPEPTPQAAPLPVSEPKPEPQPQPAPPARVTPKPAPKPEPEPEPEPVPDFFDPAITQSDDIPPDTLPQIAPLDTQQPPAPVKSPEPQQPLFNPDIVAATDEPDTLEDLPDLSELAPAPVVAEQPKPEPPAPVFNPDLVKADKRQSKLPPNLPDDIPLETAAPPPEILASEKAPVTAEESKKAVPKSQASPLDTLLKDRDSTSRRQPGTQKPGGSRPRGGGNEGGVPVAGGTRRPNPGAAGWTLAPGSWQKNGVKGGEGLIRDIRCREKDRTHLDCPEYIKKYKGRNADGLENFAPHKPLTPSTVRPSRGIPGNINVAAPGTGDRGNPSTTVLDDVNGFNGQYLNDRIGTPAQGGRVRDLFNPPEPPSWSLPPAPATPPDSDHEDDDDTLELLKKAQDDGG